MIKKILVASVFACGVGTAQAADLSSYDGLGQDITKAPYNAKCNGSADDSPAFEKAVNEGGVFFVPPGARCMLKSTNGHAWSKSTIFYGLEGARDNTHIDIGEGDNFSLRSGARVGIRNLKIKNGGNFIVANGGLKGTVHQIECINNYWENVNTWCLRWGQTNEVAGSKIGRMLIQGNTAFLKTNGEGMFAFGGAYEDIRVINNFQSGGRRGIRLGYIGNDDNSNTEVNERTNFLISGNIVRDIDGNNTTSGVTVSCIDAMGRNVVISYNLCENIYDRDEANTECIYTKSQHVAVIGNTLNNCGANQGAILLKGSQGTNIDNCSKGACARQSIVANNTVRNTDAGLNYYNCIWVQSTNALIENNHFDGCTHAAVAVVNSGSYRNITIRNNQVHNHAGSVVFDIQGNKKNIVIEGNTVYNMNKSGTTSLQGVDLYIKNGQDMEGVRIADNRFFFGNQSGTNTTGINVDVLGSGTLEDVEIFNNYFDSMDTCVKVHNNNKVNHLSIMANQMHQCGTAYKRSGSGISNGLAANNRGWSGSF